MCIYRIVQSKVVWNNLIESCVLEADQSQLYFYDSYNIIYIINYHFYVSVLVNSEQFVSVSCATQG